MKAAPIIFGLLFPAATHAAELQTKDEAHAIALDLYQHVQFVAETGLKILEGTATETDPQRLQQAAAALIGAAAQFQEKRAHDLVAASKTEGAKGSHMDRYAVCSLSALSLGNYAAGLNRSNLERLLSTGTTEQFYSQHHSCGVLLGVVFITEGTRF